MKTKRANGNRPLKSDILFTVIMCVLIAIASVFFAIASVRADMREHPEYIKTEEEREFAYGTTEKPEVEEDYTTAYALFAK